MTATNTKPPQKFIDLRDDDVVDLIKLLPCGKLVQLQSANDGIYTYAYSDFKEHFKPIIISNTFELNPIPIINDLLTELTSSELASLKRKCERFIDYGTSTYI